MNKFTQEDAKKLLKEMDLSGWVVFVWNKDGTFRSELTSITFSKQQLAYKLENWKNAGFVTYVQEVVKPKWI